MQTITTRALFIVLVIACTVATAGAEARILNTALGRWTTRDPLGYVDGVNLLAFVQGNPMKLGDPYGSVSQDPPPPQPDGTLEHCERCLERAKNDPIIKQLIEKIRGTERCADWSFDSVTCDKCDGGGGAITHEDMVTVCYNKSWLAWDCQDIIEAVRHELIHVFDWCALSEGILERDCDTVACAEIRACFGSRQCRQGGVYNNGSETEEECCRRRAANSTKAWGERNPDFDCGDGTESVNRMWDKCRDLLNPPDPFTPLDLKDNDTTVRRVRLHGSRAANCCPSIERNILF
jgi:hypothetical protein